MALDDPVVWVLILSVIIFLFGSNKIPQFARSLGQARREFENGWKGVTSEVANGPGATVALNLPKSPPSVTTRDTQFPSASTSALTLKLIRCKHQAVGSHTLLSRFRCVLAFNRRIDLCSYITWYCIHVMCLLCMSRDYLHHFVFRRGTLDLKVALHPYVLAPKSEPSQFVSHHNAGFCDLNILGSPCNCSRAFQALVLSQMFFDIVLLSFQESSDASWIRVLPAVSIPSFWQASTRGSTC